MDYGKIIQFDPGNSQYFEDLSDLGAFFCTFADLAQRRFGRGVEQKVEKL